MKSLQDYSYDVVIDLLDDPGIQGQLQYLPRKVKSHLVERLLWYDKLNASNWNCVVNKDFLSNIQVLHLPHNESVCDKLLSSVGSSGCKLKQILLVVPMIDKPGVKECPVTAGGLASLFAGQNQLEDLCLVWCVGFQAGVLTKINSPNLKRVTLHGDGLCRCFAQRHPGLRLSRVAQNPYQREVSVLALNNPTITQLSLDGILLDFDDCNTLLSALQNTLERLEIKIIRHYQFCKKQHCFFGENFIPFMELVDQTCNKLKYISCYTHEPDYQGDRQLVMQKCSTLQTVSMENHFFSRPIILPNSVRKIKLSLSGSETIQSFASLAALSHFNKLYISCTNTATHQFTPVLADILFSLLGSKIVSVTGLDFAWASNWFLCGVLAECQNLKTFDCSNSALAELNGKRRERRQALDAERTRAYCNILYPIFSDPKRARKLKNLHIGLGAISKDILGSIGLHCTELKSLDLAYCTTLDDFLLEKIAVRCSKSLKVLDISRCPFVTDQGLIAVGMNCPNLEEISLFETPVTDIGLVCLSSNCSHLKVCGLSRNTASTRTVSYMRKCCAKRLVI